MRWLLFTLVLLGGGSLVGYTIYRAHAEQADAARTSLPHGVITPDEITDTFAANTLAGEQRFGHRLVIAGVVHKVQTDKKGRAWVILETGGERESLPARFSAVDGLASLEPGQRVTATCDLAGRADVEPHRLVLLGCALGDLR